MAGTVQQLVESDEKRVSGSLGFRNTRLFPFALCYNKIVFEDVNLLESIQTHRLLSFHDWFKSKTAVSCQFVEGWLPSRSALSQRQF